MTLTPFTSAAPIIQFHILLALAAIALTIAILMLPKGSGYHRLMGRMWVATMAGIALSSFFIHELRMIGPFSPIHLLSLYVLWNLVSGIRSARAGDIAQHQRTMKTMAFSALLVAGAFTLLPGRVMHSIVLGG
ncbi:DUF2306 domain-containing protein [uncultured Sulfitobacter sp.]|uniref:DUF2306 domain-containing protein n=1 Tax=uncultured Sulfitobacter sp. TaxID=191468 RepID=UPI002606B0A0|nr:DUF2306 domain-containing protein [uncultured Sulfitobacter sp.]